MSHALIAGATESGKTTLAKCLAREYKRRGAVVLVLDPLHSKWDCAWQTPDSAAFMAKVKSSRGCQLFVDESAMVREECEDDIKWLATTSRHLGHCCHFVCHRIRQLHPTIREQCRRLFLFSHSPAEAAIVMDEYYAPELAKAERLQQFHFLLINRFTAPRSGVVDVRTQTLRIDP